jgi:hypothetical protein
MGLSVGYGVTLVTGNLTLDNTHHVLDITSGTNTITLPTASNSVGREYWIMNSTANSQTFSTYTLVSGSTSTTLAAHTMLHIISANSVWQQF